MVNSCSVFVGTDASRRVVVIWTIRVKMFDGVVTTLNDGHILELRKNMISLGTLDSNGYCYRSKVE